MNELLALEGVALGYGNQTILRDVSFTLEAGDFVGLVGPNGAGKTTLLKVLVGMHKPRAGTMRWRHDRPAIGYVPQREAPDPLWPLRVEEFVLMGRYRLGGFAGRMRAADRAHALSMLEQCRIGHLAGREVATLSGGEFQRTLVARALAGEPDLLLLDEPTASLDLALTASLLELLVTLHREREFSVILVSHDLNMIATVASDLLVVTGGTVYRETLAALADPAHLDRVFGGGVQVGEVHGRPVVLPEPLKTRNP